MNTNTLFSPRALRFSSSSRLLLLLALVFLIGVGQQAAQSRPAVAPHSNNAVQPGLYQPAADPKAIVTLGKARFTVLTPQLIRMEWAADGKFEDRASLVFLNRKLPVPKFTQDHSAMGAAQQIVLKTSALSLSYTVNGQTDSHFTAENLHIDFTLNGKQASWHPGMPDKGNLLGTTRTLDGALGGKTREPMDPGLISRDGWVVVDDSARPLFDSADFR